MSELKRVLDRGIITLEDGVLDLKWLIVTLELGDDEYLSSLGVSRIIKGQVRNPKGLVLPNVNDLNYYNSERIVLPRIVKYLELHKRTERELVITQYIYSIVIYAKNYELELFDVRCDELVLYNTLFNMYLSDLGLTRCSENYYLMKMGVCLN